MKFLELQCVSFLNTFQFCAFRLLALYSFTWAWGLLRSLRGEKISDNIVTKSLFTHRDFKERYNAYKGTGLGMAHTLWQTAVFRPKHKSSKVGNLYYTGQYNHPGIGVPTTVISSQILVDELNKKGVLT